jgi:putative glycosyltransferase (TIGR04372 family)
LLPYNSITYLLKYLDTKNIFINIFNKIIFLYLLIIIICNLSNFRRANEVFINSYAFGHSIVESSIFFNQYGHRAVCISVGNRKNRNKYIRLLFKPYILIHFWLPFLNDINIYQALRLRVHNAVNLYFKKSKIVRILLGKKLDTISREFLCNKAAVSSLQRDYNFTEQEATNLANKLFVSQSGTSESSLHYLVQQKTLIDPNFTPKITRANIKFLKKAQGFRENYPDLELKICTIVLRRSWKPWSGLGFDSYYQVVEYLSSKNYVINVVGDVEDLPKLKNSNLLSNVYFFKDYNLNSQIFQILSIINSKFCIGDQSGVQALIHFLNKRNLILNSVPFGQLQYNSVMLPRIWVDENGIKASIEEHFGTLMYRLHPTKYANNLSIHPQYYSPETVLVAVKNFVETNELNQNTLDLDLQGFFKPDSKCISQFSKNTSYSPVLFKELKF